jgi:hypothetical protein
MESADRMAHGAGRCGLDFRHRGNATMDHDVVEEHSFTEYEMQHQQVILTAALHGARFTKFGDNTGLWLLDNHPMRYIVFSNRYTAALRYLKHFGLEEPE